MKALIIDNSEETMELVSLCFKLRWPSCGGRGGFPQMQYLVLVPDNSWQPAWLVEWLGRLPYSPFKIDVIINEAVTAVANGG